MTGYYTMWVKKEEVPVIHYLQFVLDFKLTALKKKVIAYKIKRAQAKQAILHWGNLRIHHEFYMRSHLPYFCM